MISVRLICCLALAVARASDWAHVEQIRAICFALRNALEECPRHPMVAATCSDPSSELGLGHDIYCWLRVYLFARERHYKIVTIAVQMSQIKQAHSLKRSKKKTTTHVRASTARINTRICLVQRAKGNKERNLITPSGRIEHRAHNINNKLYRIRLIYSARIKSIGLRSAGGSGALVRALPPTATATNTRTHKIRINLLRTQTRVHILFIIVHNIHKIAPTHIGIIFRNTHTHTHTWIVREPERTNGYRRDRAHL